MTLSLSTTSGTETITVSQDSAAMEASVTAVVEAFNAIQTFIDYQDTTEGALKYDTGIRGLGIGFTLRSPMCPRVCPRPTASRRWPTSG